MSDNTYYTVDLARRLEPSCTFYLLKVEPELPDLRDFLCQLYPDGVSMHGYNYLCNPVPDMSNASTDSQALLVDLVFELVRLAHFPSKPSRYQCIFATESIEDARDFRKSQDYRSHKYDVLSAPIYRVIAAKDVHRGDMRLINNKCSVLELYRRAHLYWSGKTAVLYEEYRPLWEILIPLPAIIGHQVD
ncbi:DUF2441 domain-containing protein [Salmonella enterica subsp. enterica serovar Bovismorbificans]|nr:DUF2441 domain-containing protein [Salmonella enterica subsp. enterica serovar Bovismorbificans]ECB3341816.1 DUF2441 domain-containing protein [Salmonella enterica subsp. enterica serovar Bovismorbificans]